MAEAPRRQIRLSVLATISPCARGVAAPSARHYGESSGAGDGEGTGFVNADSEDAGIGCFERAEVVFNVGMVFSSLRVMCVGC